MARGLNLGLDAVLVLDLLQRTDGRGKPPPTHSAAVVDVVVDVDVDVVVDGLSPPSPASTPQPPPRRGANVRTRHRVAGRLAGSPTQ